MNLNVKIDAEVRVKLEKQAEQDIQSSPDIF
ncbi:MAG: YnbE family lipoprotein [Alphaproteobacteria bacterium]